jgi:hypothetical protein
MMAKHLINDYESIRMHAELSSYTTERSIVASKIASTDRYRFPTDFEVIFKC